MILIVIDTSVRKSRLSLSSSNRRVKKNFLRGLFAVTLGIRVDSPLRARQDGVVRSDASIP